jgi:dTDP-4-amino-4,6-dideoxygalactose transaminase
MFMLISQQKITPKVTDFFNIGNRLGPQIHKYIPKQHHYWLGSGREALRQILLNVPGNKVGMPAYTCHVVLEAVKQAGKEVIFYDSSITADIKEIKKIINDIDVLIVCHNFGFVGDLHSIAKICREYDVVLIEDCAQALGATYNGKVAGSFGDYAFYSFGISKNIGFCGGLIATNKKMRLKGLKKFPIKRLIKVMLETIIAPVFFNKYLYHFFRTMLGKELKTKQEQLNYTMPKLAKRVILNQFQRYGEILNMRRRNAKYCADYLGKVGKIEGLRDACLYYPIMVSNRDAFKVKLLEKGVELGEMDTFKSFTGKGESLKTEQQVLTFALYRGFREIKYMVKKIKQVQHETKS